MLGVLVVIMWITFLARSANIQDDAKGPRKKTSEEAKDASGKPMRQRISNPAAMDDQAVVEVTDRPNGKS